MVKSISWSSKRTKVYFSAPILGSLQLLACSSVIPLPLASIKHMPPPPIISILKTMVMLVMIIINSVLWRTYLAF